MTRLPKEKRDRLILTVLGTAILLAGLYFGLINFQLASIRNLRQQKEAADRKAADVDTSIHNAKKIDTDLTERVSQLKAMESDTASGDAYLWMVNTIRDFQPGHDVEISQFSGTSVPDTAIFPHYPYKQVAITIGGMAYYHDFGKFVADFENHFQHMRIQDITLEPPSGSTGERDKLAFRMEIVALVKSATP